MEKAQVMRFGGAAIAIIMIFSMFAVAVLYNTGDEDNQGIDVDQTLQPSAFAYTIAFDTQVLKELSALKFSAFTTHMDIQEIDRAISDIEGVRNVASSFQATGGDEWVYASEITTKKGYPLEEIAVQVSSLEYFGEYEVMKYVTVSTPDGPLSLSNAELGMDRNFQFESGTISAIAGIGTQPADFVTVSGVIRLQGNAILGIELYERPDIPPEFNIEDLNLDALLDQNIPELPDVNIPGPPDMNVPDTNGPEASE